MAGEAPASWRGGTAALRPGQHQPIAGQYRRCAHYPFSSLGWTSAASADEFPDQAGTENCRQTQVPGHGDRRSRSPSPGGRLSSVFPYRRPYRLHCPREDVSRIIRDPFKADRAGTLYPSNIFVKDEA